MKPNEKYNVNISDEQIEAYKEIFLMFDKVNETLLTIWPRLLQDFV